jgi:hypothetical protein
VFTTSTIAPDAESMNAPAVDAARNAPPHSMPASSPLSSAFVHAAVELLLRLRDRGVALVGLAALLELRPRLQDGGAVLAGFLVLARGADQRRVGLALRGFRLLGVGRADGECEHAHGDDHGAARMRRDAHG